MEKIVNESIVAGDPDLPAWVAERLRELVASYREEKMVRAEYLLLDAFAEYVRGWSNRLGEATKKEE